MQHLRLQYKIYLVLSASLIRSLTNVMQNEVNTAQQQFRMQVMTLFGFPINILFIFLSV